MGDKIFIVIAAYNEGRSIVKVVYGLKKEGYNHIIVVDDGSKDDTYKSALETKATVLRHIINRGQGAALKTGIDYALLNGADIIVTFDADGQHKASEIKDILKPIIDKKVEVTLGSRFLKKDSNIPFIKKIVLKGGIIFTWIFSGLMLTDTHNGFRGLLRDVAMKIDIKHDRMEHASEIIDEIKKKKIKFIEVPVTITYTDYSKQKGQSVLNSFRIAFKLIMRKLIGR